MGSTSSAPYVEVVVDLGDVGDITIGKQSFTLNIKASDLSITVDPSSESIIFKQKTFSASKSWDLPQEVQDKALISASASTSFKIPVSDWKDVGHEALFEARASASGTATASVKKAWISGRWYVEATIAGSIDVEVRKKRKGPPPDGFGGDITLTVCLTEVLAGLYITCALGLRLL